MLASSASCGARSEPLLSCLLFPVAGCAAQALFVGVHVGWVLAAGPARAVHGFDAEAGAQRVPCDQPAVRNERRGVGDPDDRRRAISMSVRMCAGSVNDEVIHRWATGSARATSSTTDAGGELDDQGRQDASEFRGLLFEPADVCFAVEDRAGRGSPRFQAVDGDLDGGGGLRELVVGDNRCPSSRTASARCGSSMTPTRVRSMWSYLSCARASKSGVTCAVEGTKKPLMRVHQRLRRGATGYSSLLARFSAKRVAQRNRSGRRRRER